MLSTYDAERQIGSSYIQYTRQEEIETGMCVEYDIKGNKLAFHTFRIGKKTLLVFDRWLFQIEQPPIF